MTKDEIYTDSHEKQDSRDESFSPSGRYRLVVRTYTTQTGSWEYTKGSFYRVSDGALLADIKRNYPSFWVTWVEDHPSGVDFAFCGEDYQGQTCVDLTNGQTRTHLPPEAKQGHGFCWYGAKRLGDRYLEVVGCYWACPTQYQVVDISDPMGQGWPVCVDIMDAEDSSQHPQFSIDPETGDVLFTEYQRRFRATGEWASEVEEKRYMLTREKHKAEHLKQPIPADWAERMADWERVYSPPDFSDEQEKDLWELVVDRVTRYRPTEGEDLWPSTEHPSDARLQREERWRQAAADRDAAHAAMRASDPFLAYLTQRGIPYSVGYGGYSVVNRWDGETNRARCCVRIKVTEQGDKAPTFGLEWGSDHGEIAATMWQYGKGEMTLLQAPRSPEGLEQALAVLVERGARW